MCISSRFNGAVIHTRDEWQCSSTAVPNDKDIGQPTSVVQLKAFASSQSSWYTFVYRYHVTSFVNYFAGSVFGKDKSTSLRSVFGKENSTSQAQHMVKQLHFAGAQFLVKTKAFLCSIHKNQIDDKAVNLSVFAFHTLTTSLTLANCTSSILLSLWSSTSPRSAKNPFSCLWCTSVRLCGGVTSAGRVVGRGVPNSPP